MIKSLGEDFSVHNKNLKLNMCNVVKKNASARILHLNIYTKFQSEKILKGEELYWRSNIEAPFDTDHNIIVNVFGILPVSTLFWNQVKFYKL